MEPFELFSAFADKYVDRDSQERWLSLAKRPGAIYKKSMQLERSLNKKCVYSSRDARELLLELVRRDRTVQVWDFLSAAVDKEQALENINTGTPFVAWSEKEGLALYGNGDCGGWICGGWIEK